MCVFYVHLRSPLPPPAWFRAGCVGGGWPSVAGFRSSAHLGSEPQTEVGQLRGVCRFKPAGRVGQPGVTVPDWAWHSWGQLDTWHPPLWTLAHRVSLCLTSEAQVLRGRQKRSCPPQPWGRGLAWEAAYVKFRRSICVLLTCFSGGHQLWLPAAPRCLASLLAGSAPSPPPSGSTCVQSLPERKPEVLSVFLAEC